MKKLWQNFCTSQKAGYMMPVAGGILLLSVLGFPLFFSSIEAQRTAQYEAKIRSLNLNEILADQALANYAKQTSQQLFFDHCAGCHGESGKGDKTAEGLFAPVLSDRDWLFEGKIETIHAAIADGLKGSMPAYRKTLSTRQIDQLARYVQALSEGQPEREMAGKVLFFTKGCAPCHGESGQGIPQIGAANLADNIWRFDGSFAGIKRTITYGINSGEEHDRVAVMPKFKDAGKLNNSEIKKLAIYVYLLSGASEEKHR
ncbi:MAG: c-type cytochrome [Gallionella sp.]